MPEPEHTGFFPTTPEDLAEQLPSLDDLALATFGRLDPTLAPRVHLVAVPIGLVETDEPVWWYSTTEHREVPVLEGAKAFSYGILDDGSHVPATWENRHVGGWGFDPEAVRAMVAAKIGEVDVAQNRLSFVSSFDGTEEYHAVGLVLRLHRAAAARYGGVAADARSFLRELGVAFLTAAQTFVKDQSRRAPVGVDLPAPQQLLRGAAERLIKGVLEDLPIEVPAGGLMLQLDAIAATTYERAENRGRLLISPGEFPVDVLRFDQPVSLESTRTARKLLEMSSERLALASDARTASGMVPVDPDIIPRGSVAIDFRGRHRWELRAGDQVLVRMDAGIPDVPRPQMRSEDFEAKWIEAFGAPPADAARLWSIAEAAMHQRHGTLVVFSSEAANEARRLGGASTAILPRMLQGDLVMAVTSVDGAILLDADGQCHAVGVILDGLVSARGDTGRGSRYNSTLRYIDTRAPEGGRVVAVIISEDGSVEAMATQAEQPAENPIPA